MLTLVPQQQLVTRLCCRQPCSLFIIVFCPLLALSLALADLHYLLCKMPRSSTGSKRKVSDGPEVLSTPAANTRQRQRLAEPASTASSAFSSSASPHSSVSASNVLSSRVQAMPAVHDIKPTLDHHQSQHTAHRVPHPPPSTHSSSSASSTPAPVPQPAHAASATRPASTSEVDELRRLLDEQRSVTQQLRATQQQTVSRLEALETRAASSATKTGSRSSVSSIGNAALTNSSLTRSTPLPVVGINQRKAAVAEAKYPSTPAVIRQHSTQTASTASSSSASSSSTSVGGAPVYQLMVAMKRSSPAIWRQVRLRADTDLSTLHVVMQEVWSWQDRHLHYFHAPQPAPPPTAHAAVHRGYRFHKYRVFRPASYVEIEGGIEAWDEHEEDEEGVTLDQLLRTVGERLVYAYDTGDDWEHEMVLEAIEPATRSNTRELPKCIAGQHATPPEDSGGMGYHVEMVEKYRKEKGLLSEQEKKEAEQKPVDKYASKDTVESWLKESEERVGHRYDPLYFNLFAVNLALSRAFYYLAGGHLAPSPPFDPP